MGKPVGGGRSGSGDFHFGEERTPIEEKKTESDPNLSYFFHDIFLALILFWGTVCDNMSLSFRFISGFFSILLFAGAVLELCWFFRDRARAKKKEFSDIIKKCRAHPDRDIDEVAREAVQGARFWTFKGFWKRIRDSHYIGRVFTGIFR